MKFIFPLFGLLFSLQFSFAQGCEEKIVTYGLGLDDVLIHRIIRTSDNHFLLAGQKNADALIMKVDGCGNIIWEKTHTFGTEQAFRDVLEINGKYLVTGYCIECRLGDSARKIVVQELTATGELSGVLKTLGPTNGDDADAYRVRSISGNRYAIVGTRVVTQGSVTGNSMVAYILDANYSTSAFQFFTQKKLNEIAYDIVELPSGGFVLAGTSYQISVPVSSGARLIGTNSSLNALWSNEHFDLQTLKEQSARSISRLPDGDLIIAGAKQDGNDQQLMVAKINPLNGAIKSQGTFGGNGDDFARDLYVIDQNKILVSGMHANTGISENPWGLVIGNNLTIRDEYQINNQGLFSSGVFFMEGGDPQYAFAGTLLTFPLQGVFARTASITTATQDPQKTGETLVLYPNPTQGQIHLQGWEIPVGTRFQLIDAAGKVCFDTDAREVIQLPSLPTGTYMTTLTWSEGKVQRPLVLMNK